MKNHSNFNIKLGHYRFVMVALTTLACSGLLYQNCSPATFTNNLAKDASTVNGQSTSDPGSGQTPQNPPSCSNGCSIYSGGVIVGNGTTCDSPATASSICTVSQCTAGYQPSADHLSCVPETFAKSFVCKSYVLLNPDSNNKLVVPPQDPSGQGDCYYYPVYSGPLVDGQSCVQKNHDPQVVSRFHDIENDWYNPQDVWHPYILTQNSIKFNLAGQRNILVSNLAADSKSLITIDIDNFFLVGLYPSDSQVNLNNAKSYYSAWGTADSSIGVAPNPIVDTTSVAFNPGPSGINLVTDQSDSFQCGDGVATVDKYSDKGLVTSDGSQNYVAIPLVSDFDFVDSSGVHTKVHSQGGFAQVPAVNLKTYYVPTDSNYTFDFRALDAGAGSHLSKVYLIFQ